MLDKIVEEVRNARMEHTMRFNSNLEAICADLRNIQKASGHPVVSLLPSMLPENGTKPNRSIQVVKR